jgi:hypothetical protein
VLLIVFLLNLFAYSLSRCAVSVALQSDGSRSEKKFSPSVSLWQMLHDFDVQHTTKMNGNVWQEPKLVFMNQQV